MDTQINTDLNKIKKAQKLKPHEIIAILDDYRTLSKKNSIATKKDKTILISLKVSESLLTEFKKVCEEKNLKYQTQIKALMREWLK